METASLPRYTQVWTDEKGASFINNGARVFIDCQKCAKVTRPAEYGGWIVMPDRGYPCRVLCADCGDIIPWALVRKIKIRKKPNGGTPGHCGGACLSGKKSCDCLCGGFCHGAGECHCGI